MDHDAGRLHRGFQQLRVCMAAIIMMLGLNFSDVPWVENFCEQELTMPTHHDIAAASQLYDFRSTGPLNHDDGAKILLELQSFCFRIADISNGILREFAHIEVLRDSAASLPTWITERWKSQQRKEAEAAAWPVVKRWSDIASREKYCNGLLEEGQLLLDKAETILGLVRMERSTVPKLKRLNWAQRLLKAMRSS